MDIALAVRAVHAGFTYVVVVTPQTKTGCLGKLKHERLRAVENCCEKNYVSHIASCIVHVLITVARDRPVFCMF